MKVLVMGRKPVTARCLEFLHACEDVEIVGVLTDDHLAVSPTADAARRLGLDVLSYDRLPHLLASCELRFDLALSMLYWRKLKADVLAHPRLGAINFHPAPLPEYKGCGGYNLAILEGRQDWGVTAHYMDEEIDTGDLIEVDWFPIDAERETARTLEATCQDRLLQRFKSVVGRLLAVQARLPTTPNRGGRYVTRAEMERMKEIQPHDDVSRKIRAFWFPPYDGAVVVVNGVRCTLVDRAILQALADPASSSLFSPPSVA